MKTHINRIFSILIITLFYSCQSGPDLKQYYFPIDSLSEGLVYEYELLNDAGANQSHFWFYKTHSDKGKQMFSGQYYNASGAVQQFTLEEITASKAIAQEYRLFSYDSTGKMLKADLSISKNQIYPFGKPDPEAILKFKINWTDPVETKYSNELNRGRVFQQFTQFPYKGKQLECAEFLMVENIEVEEKDAGVQTLETTTKELYTPGIGLIYYQKKIAGSATYTYQLKDRISMQEFEKRFKQ